MAFKPVIALVLFVAVTYATSVNYGWTPGKEYVYKVKSRLMSGQPELKQQFAGLELKHKLIVQVQQPDVLLIKVTETNIGELNEAILGNWYNTRIPESSSVSSEAKRMLETPFIVKMKDGQVDYVKVEDTEVHFIRNFKKALASTLQLNNRAILPAQLSRVDNKIVKVMEESIVGECEVVYEKHLMPEFVAESVHQERVPVIEACRDSPVWEVTKTTNFTNCKTLPVYNTITPLPKGPMKCLPGDNGCKLYWERTFQTRFVLCGTAERGLIQSIDAEEEFLVQPFGYKTEKLMGGTTTNMTLHDIRPLTTQIRMPRNLMTIQNLEMRQPIFRHQQREGDSYMVRSQDDFEHGRMVNFDSEFNNNNEESTSYYPSINKNSDMYSRMFEQESRNHRFVRSINDDDFESESEYEQGQFAPRNNYYGKSHMRNYWSRLFRPTYEREQEQEMRSTRYPTTYGQKSSVSSRLDRDQPIKTGAYPYPSLSKPLLFVHPKRINFQEVISTVPELTREIALNLEHPSTLAQKNVLDKIVSLATKLELLNLEQLHKVYQMTVISATSYPRHESSSSNDNEHMIKKTIKNVFFDALAMSGTNPAIVLIKQLIKKEEIRGERAAQLIMTFPKYAKTPTKELIDEIFDLATSVPEHKEQIRTTALLAFSQLVNKACISPRAQYTRYPVEIFGKFCHQDAALIQKYVTYLSQRLHQTQSEYKKTVYIHALGNIGHKSIIQALKPIISNEVKSSANVRSKAIQALKKLVEPKSFYVKYDRALVKHVTQFLVSVVLDPTIHYQVRMSAFEVFTVCDAPLVYWQKIAMRTWFEPSAQVAAYIRSTFKSYSQLKESTKLAPHFRSLMKKSKLVLPLCKPMKEGIHLSYNQIISHYIDEMELGYIQQLSSYGAKDSIVPETIKFATMHQLGGFNFEPLEVVLKTKNIREVVEKLLHQYVFFPLNRESGHNSQLDKIKEILNVEPRLPKGPLEGSLFVKLAEEIQRIYPVNHESLTHLIKKFIEEYPRLQNGIPINYQKTLNLADMTVVLPTQLGVPYILKIRAPALISLKGHIKIETQQPETRGQITIPEKVKIVFDLSPVYTWKVIATSGFTTYSDMKTYATGVEKKFTFHLPGAVVIRADLKEKKIAITHVLPETQKVQNPTDVEIVTYKVKPFTTIYNLKKMASITHTDLLKTIKKTEEPKKVNKHIGYKWLGLAAKLEQTTDGELEDVHDILKKIVLHKPTTLAHFWSASKTNQLRKYRLTLDLQQSQTKETTILFDFDKIVKSVATLETSEIASGRQFTNAYDEEMTSRHNSGKPFFPRSSVYDKYETSRDEERIENYHGLKKEYTLDSDDEYTTSSRRQYGQGLITRFDGHHETEMERIVVDKILSQMTSGYVYKVKAALILRGTEKRDYTTNLIVAMNPTNTIKKVQFLYERSPMSHYERQSFKVLVDAEAKFPHVPIADLSIAQSMDMTSFLKAKIFAGHNIESQSQIRIEGVMKRNEEVKQYLETIKKVAECEKNQQHGFRLHPTCVNATTVASMLNEYHFNIEYHNVPAELKNMTYHIEDFITAVWYPYMSTNHADVQNQNNKVQVFVKVHPIQKNFDLKIKKPTATIVFNKVPLDTKKQTVFPIYAKKSIVARTLNKVLGGYYNTKCLMGKSKVATFDKVVYDAKLKSQAFHLLTKDCSGMYKFAVLVKQQESKKVVRVIVKNTVIQTMPVSSRMFSSNGLRVIVNGREQVLPVDKIVEITEQGKVVVRLIAKPNGVIEISAPKHGFVVLTNGEQVIVKASNFLRSKLCGLCGDFNGEKSADLKTPEKCVESPREPHDFVRSYAIESSNIHNKFNQYDNEEQRTPSYLSKYIGTPVSYLTNYFGGRKYDNEREEREYADEINFGSRTQYTRNQCVKELDDSTRVGKQWKQQNSLIGGGDHDMRRSWESNQYDNEYNNKYESGNYMGNRYDNEYQTEEYDQDKYNSRDLFENQWMNREHRRRFQDEDDFQTENKFNNEYDSSLFNRDRLFENEFAGRSFGVWGNESDNEKEWEVEDRLYNQYNNQNNNQYNNNDEEIQSRFDQSRRHFNNIDSQEEEMDLDTPRQSRFYNNQKYDTEFEKEFDTEYKYNTNKYDNSLDSEEEKERNYYNRNNQYNQEFNNNQEDSEEQTYNNKYNNKYEQEDDFQQDMYPFASKQLKSEESRRCTVLKHKIIERNGKQCFSIRPRVQCNKHDEQCKPIQHQTKEVKFYCAQTPLEARYLESKVRQQPVVQQLLQKPTHFVEEIELPTECTVRSY